MLANVIDGRMYLPPEDESKPNERTIMHPETNDNQVIVEGTGMYLKDFLGHQIRLSQQKPEEPRPILWLKVTGTRNT